MRRVPMQSGKWNSIGGLRHRRRRLALRHRDAGHTNMDLLCPSALNYSSLRPENDVTCAGKVVGSDEHLFWKWLKLKASLNTKSVSLLTGHQR